MKIGLFFGSFNPIHTGHLIISTYVTNFFTDKVWFIVSPQNPFKNNTDLLDFDKRLLLAISAIKNNPQFEVSDIEEKLPLPSYTINTIALLKKTYPQHDYFLIMGSDNFLNIESWNSYELLLNEKFLVYERPGFNVNPNKLTKNTILMDAPFINISSTEIRELIKAKKSIRYIVPDEVAKLIYAEKLYS